MDGLNDLHVKSGSTVIEVKHSSSMREFYLFLSFLDLLLSLNDWCHFCWFNLIISLELWESDLGLPVERLLLS